MYRSPLRVAIRLSTHCSSAYRRFTDNIIIFTGGLQQTSLVAGQTTSWIQYGQLGILSAVKQSTWLPGRRYSSRLRKLCSLPQVFFGEKVFCHSCSQSFWWQMFCCSWTTDMEWLTCQSARQEGSQLHRIQKTTENNVSDGQRRIVPFLIIAPYEYSYLLTYLLQHLSSASVASDLKALYKSVIIIIIIIFLTLGKYIPEGFKKLKNVT